MLHALEPKDEYNRTLEQRVRPPGWSNPEPEGPYNLVVIGAGTAGLVAAAGAAGLGARVALIERGLMGGDCLNAGCVPSKGLIRAARAAAAVKQAREFGIVLNGTPTIDFAAAMQRMRRLRAEIAAHDSAARFRDLGVDVYLGEARFGGPDTVEVDGQTLPFSKALIATGSRAAAPPIDGLHDVDYLTNETLFSLTELPQRLGIIGAGPIGCEMAQAFAQLGAEVYLVEAQHGILQKEDRDCAAVVETALREDGVHLLCCGKEMRVRSSDGTVRLQLESHDEGYDLSVDHLLVAVGRAPNIEELNLEAAGVDSTEHGVTVDDRLRTANHNIFAAGDVCTRYKFTHAADFMARIVVQNALFMGHSRFSDLVIPWCTYTTPEIAHVGVTEQDAEKQGLDIDTYRRAFSEVDRAVLDGESEGLTKVHCERGKDRILGATVVAHDAGNMISEFTLAMNNNVGLGGIGGTIHPYPTQAEAGRQLGDEYRRTKLTPLVESVIDRWLTWRR